MRSLIESAELNSVTTQPLFASLSLQPDLISQSRIAFMAARITPSPPGARPGGVRSVKSRSFLPGHRTTLTLAPRRHKPFHRRRPPRHPQRTPQRRQSRDERRSGQRVQPGLETTRRILCVAHHNWP